MFKQSLKNSLLAGTMILAMAGPAGADYVVGKQAFERGVFTTAYREFKDSADRDHVLSQYMMGRMFAEGRGVAQDFSQAHMWFNLAALNGYAHAGLVRDALEGQMSAYQLQRARTMEDDWRLAHPRYASAQPVSAPTAYALPYSVRNVQQLLNELGYSAGYADGFVGSGTRSAIRAYQTDKRLRVSGEPSVALFDHLQATKAARQQAVATTVTAPATKFVPAKMIAEIQAELRERGYDVPAVSGRVDAQTTAAIRAYQADASLGVTGQPSERLLNQLRSASNDDGAAYRDQVKQLQMALNERGYDAGPADGALGPRVRSAIRNYQADAGLPVTGEMTASLLEKLELVASAPPATGSTGGGYGSFESGSFSRLSELEDQLQRRGYAVGLVDGQMDAQTDIAIRAYQQDAGLRVDGKASQSLLNQLRTSTVRNESATENQRVWQIENELQSRGYDVGTVDGTFDDQTVSAIKSFERDNNLKVTGRATYMLLGHLVNAPGKATTTLTIRDIETELSRRGYDTGAVDGIENQETSAAIRDYQSDAGLPVTGRADAGLLQHLQASDIYKVSARDVSEIESLLNRRGYSVGPIDGVVDAHSADAIRAYQRDAGLAVTGRADTGLLDHLRTSKVSTNDAALRGLANTIIRVIGESN